MSATRTRLGTTAQVFARESVYELEDGLEVEMMENYEVMRKRVLFEEVLLVTYHREKGIWFILLTTLAGGFFLLMGVSVASVQRTGTIWPVLFIWLILAFPFLFFAALRAIMGVDVVSVFGKRSKASVRFAYRKKRAREVYVRIVSRVRQAQRALEREMAQTTAAAVPQAPAPEMPPFPAADLSPFDTPDNSGGALGSA